MFEFVIDLFKAIFKSIFGNAHQRKTAGAVAFLTLLALTFGAFTAWVSQPRYKDILFGLSDTHAWFISIAIALGMSFGITKLSYDLYRSIQLKTKLPSNFAPLLILILLVGTFDCIKNFEGAEDRSRFLDEVNKYANGAIKPYSEDLLKLETEKQEIFKQYTWKGNLDFRPKPYSRHSAATHRMHKSRIDLIEASIVDFESKQLAEINEYDSLRKERNKIGKGKSEKAHTGLWWMSLSVYFLQVIIGYFLVGAMDELDGKKDGEISFGLETEDNEGLIAQIKDKLFKKAQPVADSSDSEPIGFKHLKPEKLEPNEIKRQGVGLKEDSYKRAESGNDYEALLNEILGRLESIEKGKSSGHMPPIEYRFTTENQPTRKGPKRNGKRVEAMESRNAILSAFNALKAAGKKPTQQAIANATGISRKTVGNHMREMKREGLLK